MSFRRPRLAFDTYTIPLGYLNKRETLYTTSLNLFTLNCLIVIFELLSATNETPLAAANTGGPEKADFSSADGLWVVVCSSRIALTVSKLSNQVLRTSESEETKDKLRWKSLDNTIKKKLAT